MFILKTNLNDQRNDRFQTITKRKKRTVWALITISLAIKSSVCRADTSISLFDERTNRPSSADRLNQNNNYICSFVFSVYLRFLSELIELVTRCGSSNRVLLESIVKSFV